MSDKSGIEWTDATWPVVTGCDYASPGCANCYAVRDANRLGHNPNPKTAAAYGGLVVKNAAGALRWTGVVRLLHDRLDWPLRWTKPRRIFVCNQSDLFHEDVPDDFIDRVFAVMALCPQHTFQVLTKRAERMRAYLGHPEREASWMNAVAWALESLDQLDGPTPEILAQADEWNPLPNVWLGVSVENQRFADERIPLLLQTPAAVRFISAEPLLGPVDFGHWMVSPADRKRRQDEAYWRFSRQARAKPPSLADPAAYAPSIDWVIVGGESGSGARRNDAAWVRSIVRQCQAAGVAAFVKQLGAFVIDRNDAGFDGIEPQHWPEALGMDTDRIEHDFDGTRDGYQGAPVRIHLLDRKGGDMAEWPEDLRVRQFPTVRG